MTLCVTGIDDVYQVYFAVVVAVVLREVYCAVDQVAGFVHQIMGFVV